MTSTPGFLTEKDRKFLRGEIEYESKQGRYARRQSIRERTRSAFADFSLLHEHLPDDEYEKIFSVNDDGEHRSVVDGYPSPEECIEGEMGRYEYYRVLSDTLAFVFLASRVIEKQVLVSDQFADIKRFDTLLERGVQLAIDSRTDNSQILHTVEFSIEELDLSLVDEERVGEKLSEGGISELTDRELRYFLQSLSEREDFDELIPETIDSGSIPDL